MEKVVQRSWTQPIEDPRLLDLAKEAAFIYNAALRTFWQFLDKGKYLNIYDLQGRMAEFRGPLLYSNTRVAAIQQFSKAFSAYRKAKKAYDKDPSKFTGCPMPPKTEKETQAIFFKNPSIRVRDGFLLLPLSLGNEPIKVRWDINLGKPIWASINWNPISGWELHLVLTRTVQEDGRLDPDKIEGIDLGVKRAATTCDDNGRVVTYSGKAIKSLVREREKLKAKTASKRAGLKKHSYRYRRIGRGLRRKTRRNGNRMKDVLHKASRTMVNDCVQEGVGMAVIGDCSSVHDSPNLGKSNNQAINQNPEQRLRKYFEYKFEAIGGRTASVPENYTTKTCPKCGKINRPHNREYKCSCGFRYDRDGVGALNIWGLGRQVSLGGAYGALGRRGPLTGPIGWKYKSCRDCYVGRLKAA